MRQRREPGRTIPFPGGKYLSLSFNHLVDSPKEASILNHMVELETSRLGRVVEVSGADPGPWIPCDDASLEDFWSDRLDLLERLLREEDANQSPTREGDDP